MLRRLLGEVAVWQRPTLPVSGNDLLARGLRGPVLGGVLQDIEQRWVESDFILSREALLSSIPA
jgi:poly(A) polymerase